MELRSRYKMPAVSVYDEILPVSRVSGGGIYPKFSRDSFAVIVGPPSQSITWRGAGEDVILFV